MFIYTDGIEVAFSEDTRVDTQRWREELVRRRELTTEELLMDFAATSIPKPEALRPKTT
jgi:hypothetical protein